MTEPTEDAEVRTLSPGEKAIGAQLADAMAPMIDMTVHRLIGVGVPYEWAVTHAVHRLVVEAAKRAIFLRLNYLGGEPSREKWLAAVGADFDFAMQVINRGRQHEWKEVVAADGEEATETDAR